MREWMKKTNNKALMKAMGLVFIIFFCIWLMVAFIAIAEGDESISVGLMFMLFSGIFVFIYILTAWLNKSRINKLIKAQESIGINFDCEVGDIEMLKDCGFSGDWFLYSNGIGLAYHKSFITGVRAGRVQNGKYMTPGIYLSTVDGKEHPLALNKKVIDEVVLRLNTWIGNRPEYQFSEGEVTSTETQLERQISGENVSRDWKSVGIVLGVGVVAMIICLVVYSILAPNSSLGESNSTPEIIAQLNEASEYDTIDLYTNDLHVEKLSSSDVEINVYLDAMEEENTYFLEVQNESDYFIDGTLVLSDDDGNEIDNLPIYMARPNSSVMGTVELSEYPSKYVIEDSTYFSFYYPCDADYTTVDDYDDEYQWTNVIIDENDYSNESIEEVLKRVYAECVVSDIWTNLVYVYNENTAETYEYNGYDFYDTYSSEYMAYILLDEKIIELYSFDENDQAVLEQTWEME